MFHTVEKYKTPAQILLGLIALTFVGFGVSTVAAPGSDFIVKIGDEKISEYSLNNELQGEQLQGQSPSRGAVFQSLVQRAYLKEGAKLMGVEVSQEQLKQLIVDDPNFHDQNGKFSQQIFSNFLSQRHMTEDQFVADIRERYALQSLINLVQNGAIISDAQAEQLIKLTQATRDIRSVTFNPESFVSQVKVDDAALKAYYEAHKKDYLIPQGVKLEYIALSAKDLADKQTVSEDEVKKAFDEQAPHLSPRREIAHIFFPVPQDADETVRAAIKAEADKVAAELKAKPADFADLAKKYSKDTTSASKGGNLGYLSKDGGLGTDLENVAFSLPKGGISDVVQTPVGYDIVQVLNIEDKVSFEHEKARIEAELKLKKAASEFNSAKEKLSEEAFNTPTSLADVAKKTNLKLESLDQDWLTQANGKAAGLPDALINAAFSEDVLKKKHNSDLISMDKDTVWVIRVKEVREEKTAPFADVQEEVRLAYLRSEAAKLADKKAKEAIEALKAGKAVDLKWSEVSKLSAQDARRTMAPEAYNELIKARPQNGKPAYAMLLEGMPTPVIVEVQNIAAPENIASQVPAAKQMLAQQQSANIFDALLRYFSKEIKREQGAQKVDNSAE